MVVRPSRIVALANAGYVAVLPDYRLYPKVRFPQFVEDGALAVKWVHTRAAEFGGDPNAVFLMGHSADAHLAILALDPRYLRKAGGDPGWVRAWIGLSGPYAIERQNPILREIFPEMPGAERWQPVALVNGRSPAALLIHGTAQSGTPCPALNLRRDWESPLKAGAARGRNTADASAQR